MLSRPYILASDNQLASITVGNEVPFITNTRITDTGQQINTIQYQDVGIILNVTPHVNPDGLVIGLYRFEATTLTLEKLMAALARMGLRKSTSPAASTGYQTGNGTPKKRWRVMFQSPCRPLTQFS